MEYKEQVKTKNGKKTVIITDKCNHCVWGRKEGTVVFCFRFPCPYEKEQYMKPHGCFGSIKNKRE